MATSPVSQCKETHAWLAPVLLSILFAAFNYPVKPPKTNPRRQAYARWLVALMEVLPCDVCRRNFRSAAKDLLTGSDSSGYGSRPVFSRACYELVRSLDTSACVTGVEWFSTFINCRKTFESWRVKSTPQDTQAKKSRKKARKKKVSYPCSKIELVEAKHEHVVTLCQECIARRSMEGDDDHASNEGFPTSLWGPIWWESIHGICNGAPVVMSKTKSAQYLEWIVATGGVLPCGVCRSHYPDRLETAGLNAYAGIAFASRDSIVRFGFQLHVVVTHKLRNGGSIDFFTLADLRKHHAEASRSSTSCCIRIGSK